MPLRVISRYFPTHASYLLCPRKQTLALHKSMSAKGQKRTHASHHYRAAFNSCGIEKMKSSLLLGL